MICFQLHSNDKNLQVLDKEALEKPQVLDTEAICGYVVTDPVVLSTLEKLPSC